LATITILDGGFDAGFDAGSGSGSGAGFEGLKVATLGALSGAHQGEP
jgi:hypothetical protein